MQRYFTTVIDNIATLNDIDKHHFLSVMRAKIGDNAEIVSNGKTYICELISTNPCELKVCYEKEENHELRTDLILMLSLLKGEKMDFVIQKAVEIGVSKIILVRSKYCISKISKEDESKKLDRYNKIAKEASQQSKRNIIPCIEKIIDFKQIKDINEGLKLIGDVNDSLSSSELKENLSKESNGQIYMFIGPEGGFSEEEIDFAHNSGFKSVSFGKRVLRAETAALSSLSILAFLLED